LRLRLSACCLLSGAAERLRPERQVTDASSRAAPRRALTCDVTGGAARAGAGRRGDRVANLEEHREPRKIRVHDALAAAPIPHSNI